MNVLTPYDQELCIKLNKSYHSWYKACFHKLEEQTDHYLPLAKLPKLTVPAGHYPRAVVKIKDKGVFSIGTETHDPNIMGKITGENAKTLLKHGVLRAVLQDDIKLAQKYFDMAMKLWDGNGFTEKRTKPGHYHTRNLAYALIAANALNTKLPNGLEKKVEQRLWACQDKDGGIWTDYLANGRIPDFAKKTNEIAPLTLLAYDRKRWL